MSVEGELRVNTPTIEQIQHYYDSKEQEILAKNPASKDHDAVIERIYHEAFALDLVLGALRRYRIKHTFTLDDLNLFLPDQAGVQCEIDFRIIIEGSPILFGATRFNYNDRDLQKDFKTTDIPVSDFKINGRPIPQGILRITGIQSRASVIRRKIAVRIATEGKHEFGQDYVYVMFCYDRPRDVWPDIIPPTFEFETPERDNYFLKQKAFSGICLVGALRKADGTIDTSGFFCRTHTFPRAGQVVKRLLSVLDRAQVNW